MERCTGDDCEESTFDDGLCFQHLVLKRFDNLQDDVTELQSQLDDLSERQEDEMTVEQDIQAEIDAIQVDEAASGAQLDAIEAKINSQTNTGGISASAAATLLANVTTIRQAADAEAARISGDAGTTTPPTLPAPVVTVDPVTGNTTTVTTAADGSTTTVITDPNGNVIP